MGSLLGACVSRTVEPMMVSRDGRTTQCGGSSRDRRSRPPRKNISRVHSRTKTTSRSGHSRADPITNPESKSPTKSPSEQFHSPIAYTGGSTGDTCGVYVDGSLQDAGGRRHESNPGQDVRSGRQGYSKIITDLPRLKASGGGLKRSAGNSLSRRDKKGYHGEQKFHRRRQFVEYSFTLVKSVGTNVSLVLIQILLG